MKIASQGADGMVRFLVPEKVEYPKTDELSDLASSVEPYIGPVHVRPISPYRSKGRKLLTLEPINLAVLRALGDFECFNITDGVEEFCERAKLKVLGDLPGGRPSRAAKNAAFDLMIDFDYRKFSSKIWTLGERFRSIDFEDYELIEDLFSEMVRFYYLRMFDRYVPSTGEPKITYPGLPKR